MPKVLIYLYWIFLFYNTDYNENRGHVHVGKRANRKLCKIWLEPTVECADPGDLTDAQVKEVLELTVNYQSKLLEQWKLFKAGKKVKTIKNNDMYKNEGYWNVVPEIKSVAFPKRGKFLVDLKDGRSILMPTSMFPCLKKVPVKQRADWYLIGGGVTWDSCPEVIHIEQILGNYVNYAHEQKMSSQIQPLMVCDDTEANYKP